MIWRSSYVAGAGVKGQGAGLVGEAGEGEGGGAWRGHCEGVAAAAAAAAAAASCAAAALTRPRRRRHARSAGARGARSLGLRRGGRGGRAAAAAPAAACKTVVALGWLTPDGLPQMRGGARPGRCCGGGASGQQRRSESVAEHAEGGALHRPSREGARGAAHPLPRRVRAK
eukprot:95442-Chlamydomonas_euryale.AAC.3